MHDLPGGKGYAIACMSIRKSPSSKQGMALYGRYLSVCGLARDLGIVDAPYRIDLPLVSWGSLRNGKGKATTARLLLPSSVSTSVA